jgi:hypothetical protein
MPNESLKTFLFAWNPVKYPWPEIGEQCQQLKAGKKIIESWSCASHKKVRPGDRAFLVLVGAEPRGIFGSGYMASEPFIGKDHRGNMKHRILIDFDVLLDPKKETILTLSLLSIGKMARQVWAPQASGIIIKPEITDELEALWEDFLRMDKRLIQ